MDPIIVDYGPQLAATAADLANACRHSWPWDFTEGIPFTAASVEARLRRRNTLAVLLSVEGDVARGYLELIPFPGDPDAAYVALVYVHPDYHGRGIGRALLREAVERTTQLGLGRLDLHTWPSHLKAVPLYKGLGFFWVPGTEVWMQNYIPSLLANPVAAPFFDRHDWGRTLVRDAGVCEDRQTWRGMDCFTYRWQAGSSQLEAIIDRHARGLTAITTPQLCCSCHTDHHRPAAGAQATFSWSLAAPGAAELAVEGAGYIDLGFSTRLEPGASLTRRATITAAAADAHPDDAAPALHSTLQLGEDRLLLKTAARASHPVELVTDPSPPVLVPGRSAPLSLGLVNPSSTHSISGTMYLKPGPGLSLGAEAGPLEFQLEPRRRTGLQLELTCDGEGAHHIEWWARVQLDGREFTTAPRQLQLLATGGAAVGAACYTRAYLANPHLLLTVDRRGGEFTLLDRSTGLRVARGRSESLGPPFEPSEFAGHTYSPEVSGNSIRLTADSTSCAQLTWTSTLRLEGQLLLVENSYTYGGQRPRELELLQQVTPTIDGGILTLPLSGGLVRQRAQHGDFPGRWRDLTLEADGWAETWTAYEAGGSCLGVIWDGARQVEAEHQTRVIRQLELAPGAGSLNHPLAIYAGPGDWRTVRHFWRLLLGRQDQALGQPAPVLRASFCGREPGEPLLLPAGGAASVRVQNLRGRPLEAGLQLEPPAGFGVEPEAVQLAGLTADSPAEFQLQIRPPGHEPSAGAIRAAVDTGVSTKWLALPLIAPGCGAEVRISRRDDLWLLDNGRLSLEVAPAFCGALVGLRQGPDQLLLSSYPTPGEFSWVKPWYGGLHPVLPTEPYSGPGSLPDEPHQTGELATRGRSGHLWRGVEISFELERAESLRGARLVASYLTLPGSNLVAASYHLHNPTASPMEASPGFWAFPAAPIGALLQSRHDSCLHGRQSGKGEAWIVSEGFAAVETSGPSLVLAGPSRLGIAALEGHSPIWGLLPHDAQRLLPPGGSWLVQLYLVVTTPDRVGSYVPLAAATQLP